MKVVCTVLAVASMRSMQDYLAVCSGMEYLVAVTLVKLYAMVCFTREK